MSNVYVVSHPSSIGDCGAQYDAVLSFHDELDTVPGCEAQQIADLFRNRRLAG